MTLNFVKIIVYVKNLITIMVREVWNITKRCFSLQKDVSIHANIVYY
jgi:hypothetical protein